MSVTKRYHWNKKNGWAKFKFIYFNIVYKKGKENLDIDGLSRKHDSDTSLCIISIIIPQGILGVQTEYVKNQNTRKMIEEVHRNKEANSKYSWGKDIIWYKQRIYLPSWSKFKTQVLKENHDSPTVGHVGFFKTYHNT